MNAFSTISSMVTRYAESIPSASASRVFCELLQTFLTAKVVHLSSNGGPQGRFFGDIGPAVRILDQFLVNRGWGCTVPLELLVRAQDRDEDLFQGIVAEIEQYEDNEISHVPMMKQRRMFVNLPSPITLTIGDKITRAHMISH